MTICSECKKKYKTYMVILCDKIESMAFEMSLRDIFYDQEKDQGLCKECRDKFMKDDVWMWRHWLLASASIMVVRSRLKGGKKIKWTKALKRIDEIDKRLEKSKAVRKILEKNKKEFEEGKEYGYF